MNGQHPAMLILPQIDPRLRQVSSELLQRHQDQPLRVTMLFMAHFMAIDGTLQLTAEGVELTTSVEFTPVGLWEPDGTLKLSALGITTCQCPPSLHASPRWNPLCLTVEWFQGLSPLLPTISARFFELIKTLEGEFCAGGLRWLRSQGLI